MISRCTTPATGIGRSSHCGPGEEISVKVNRFAEDGTTLKLKGWEPQREAVVYWDWHSCFAAGCAVFVVLLLATQPLPPRWAIWRPILLVLSGLAVIAALLLATWSWHCSHAAGRWTTWLILGHSSRFAWAWLPASRFGNMGNTENPAGMAEGDGGRMKDGMKDEE